MNKYFNTKRFGFLIKEEVLTNYKMGIYFITIVGIYTVLAILSFTVSSLTDAAINRNSINYMFPGFLFIGGYIFSSLIFSDINDKFKSSLWFSLPASTLEKYVVGVLLSGLGYIIFLNIAFLVGSLVSNALTQPIFKDGMELFNPVKLFSIDELDSSFFSASIIFLVYIFTHSVFIIGSIVFKKAAFIKTALASSIVSIAYSIIFGFLGYYIGKLGLADHWDIRVLMSVERYFEELFNSGNLVSFLYRIFIIPGIIFTLFFNVVGYIKLTEKEVKGGI
ncbi:MAG: hypothetical protein JXR64_06495 [Spirochaetales bacterium]|nr:hypothetical protein [Spirochaetales bacterium]